MKERKHILVCEDDATLRKVLVMKLEKEGYQVSSTGETEQAISFIKNFEFKAIVTDSLPPTKENKDILSTLRTNSDRTPLFIITGRSTSEILPKTRNTNLKEILEKPFSVDELVTKLDRNISQEETSSATKTAIYDRRKSVMVLNRLYGNRKIFNFFFVVSSVLLSFALFYFSYNEINNFILAAKEERTAELQTRKEENKEENRVKSSLIFKDGQGTSQPVTGKEKFFRCASCFSAIAGVPGDIGNCRFCNSRIYLPQEPENNRAKK